METLLIDEWTRGLSPIPIVDVASVSLAREAVRVAGARLGLGDPVIGALAIVASELGHNQLAHGAFGRLAVVGVERGGTPGIEIVAADAGNGFSDPTGAFEGAPRPGASLGTGLAGVRSLADEVDVDVRLGEGTCIRARKFGAAVGRRREVAILGRPFPGERWSGDRAGFRRTEGGLLVYLVDGLGHGAEARDAADVAASTLSGSGDGSSRELLGDVDAALARTRGAVMTIARLDEVAGRLDYASVGNVATHLVRFRRTRVLNGSAFVLGVRTPGPKRIDGSHVAIDADELLLMCSDGISSRVAIDASRDLLHASPIAIAQHVLETYGQRNDDATVLVAR